MPIPSTFPDCMQGENRVTLAMRVVFERISVQLVERTLGLALEDGTFG